MKKVGDILKEMGFRPEGSEAVKEAFVRHLIKSATGVDVAKKSPVSKSGEQLSFDFTSVPEKQTKKSS